MGAHFFGRNDGSGTLDSIKNSPYTQGVYHFPNKCIKLFAELIDEKVTKVAGSNFDNKNRMLSFGGLIFF